MSTTPPRSSPSTSELTPAQRRWRKIVRRGMLAGVVVLVLFGAVFVLLPVWISNEQGRLYILDRLNDRLRGPKVQVEGWSLGWFRTTELEKVKVVLPDGSTLLTCPHVTSGLTLWDIFWSNYDIRNTTADQLEMRVTKYSDGSTSLDPLTLGAAEILQSARGALQVKDGVITVLSEGAGESVRYGQVNAAISIASPDAPFTVHVSAVDLGGRGPANGSLSLDGTFPPTSTLTRANLASPGAWALLNEVSFSASGLPSALACDFLNVDKSWVKSFGNTFEKFQFSAHTPPGQDTRLTLTVKGNGEGEPPMADAVLLLRGKVGAGASLVMAGDADYRLVGGLKYSPPLAKLLGRLNPVLGEAMGSGEGLVRGTASRFVMPLERPEEANMAGRITFPSLQFTPRDGPSLVRQLLVVTGGPTSGAKVDGGADLLSFRLADKRFSYENFRVTLGRSRIVFSGSETLDGKLDLGATLPDASSGLAAESRRVLVTGTVDMPLIKRAE